MKFAPFRLFFALFAILALTLAGCSSDSSTNESAADAASEAADVIEETNDTAGEVLSEAASEAEAAVNSGDFGLATPGTIVVGSEIAFEPFEYYDNNEAVGFDVDLINEVASRLDLEVELIDTPWDTIFTQLAGGEFDAIISAVTITEERDATIDFSTPYFAANQALSVPEGSSITGVNDLTDEMVLGVQSGTTGADYALENFSAKINEFPSAVDAFNALAAGQIDAVFIDLPVAGAQEANGNLTVEEVDTNELYGIGIQEGNTALAAAIDEQIKAIIADGTYAELYSKWFEGAVPAQFAGE